MRIARTTRTALFAVLGICFMTGLAFASVPLYRLFCAATGLNGTTQRGLIAPGSVHHRIRIDFDANTSPHMPWRFVPEQGSETVEVGARDMAFFTATNRAAVPVTGTATYNVTPYQAGKYFTKIQCFCFTEHTLKPGESFEYTSGCPLSTSSGIMVGTYQMQTETGELFLVDIPAFSLDVPNTARVVH